MTIEPTVLTQRLQELAETPAPPTRVDVDLARAAGRRRLHRRRAGIAGSLVALALAAGLAVTTLPRAAGPQVPPLAAAPRGSDPLLAHVSFGWLPAGMAGVGYQVGAHGDLTVARGSGTLPTHLWLSLYPKGSVPVLGRFPDGARQMRVPADPVGGNPAYWVSADAKDPTNHGDTFLRWRTASGQWAELHGYYLHTVDVAGVLHHVASTVTTGDIPVPLPLRISGLPAQLHVYEVDLNRPSPDDDASWSVQLSFTQDGTSLSIDVRPANATARTGAGSCTTAHGLRMCIDTNGTPPALAAIGGTAGLQQRITLLGTAERDWTTDVLIR